MPDLVIRPAVQDDLEVLWDFLAMAAYEPDGEAARAVPSVAKYIVAGGDPGISGSSPNRTAKSSVQPWHGAFPPNGSSSPMGTKRLRRC